MLDGNRTRMQSVRLFLRTKVYSIVNLVPDEAVDNQKVGGKTQRHNIWGCRFR